MLKRLYYIGFIAYIIMLFLSLLFYKERTIFIDSAFNLFYIIKNNSFIIQIYRFGDALNQALPLFARKAGQPLNTIFQCYSSGFIINYFIAYFICGSILKRYDFSLVILLFNVIFVTHTFYWILSELPQATALLMVIFAFVAGKRFNKFKPLTWSLLFIPLVTVVFFHPLIIFVLAFAILFFMQGNNPIIDKKFLSSIAIIYTAVLLIKFFLFKTPYETHSMSGLKNFITLFPDYFTTFSNKRFLQNCLTIYYWIPVFFVAITAFYIKIKARRKLLLFVSFFIGYIALVNISYPSPVTPAFYIENLYLPLGIFLVLPFVFDLLPLLEKKKLALPVALLVIITGCIRIYTAHPIYTARLAYERNILDKYGEQKVILQATKNDSDILLMTWGTPYEFLLLSESERHKPASIIVDPDPALRIPAGSHKNALVVNYNIIPYNQLNPTYFHFTDTTSCYTIIY